MYSILTEKLHFFFNDFYIMVYYLLNLMPALIIARHFAANPAKFYSHFIFLRL